MCGCSEPDDRQLGLLRVGGQRPCHCAAEIVDEHSPPHRGPPKKEIGKISGRNAHRMYFGKCCVAPGACMRRSRWIHSGEVRNSNQARFLLPCFPHEPTSVPHSVPGCAAGGLDEEKHSLPAAGSTARDLGAIAPVSQPTSRSGLPGGVSASSS